MNNDIQNRFNQITIWKNNGKRAPHKPLLILLTLGKINSKTFSQFYSYSEIEQPLKDLITEFGLYSKTVSPQYPFWRLQNDGIWELRNADKVNVAPNGDVNVGDLRSYNVKGGFPDYIFNKFCSDQSLVTQITNHLLDAHFPESLHEDIKKAVGLGNNYIKSKQKKRNPDFRPRILRAYEYKCAVCEFDVRYNNQPIGLEAAHIKWHQAGGPDVEENGLALCIMHHKLFDRGAFTINHKMVLCVSEFVHGGKGFVEWLMQFHNKKIILPQRPSYYPKPEFMRWHVSEVFKGKPRYYK